jgi:glucosamine--fructose-6-phosphate aminotransferase (isomerizing)
MMAGDFIASNPGGGEARGARSAQATLMYREAAESSACVSRQLELDAERIAEFAARLRALAPRAVITCARGSSDHAATFARYLIETQLGLLTSSASPSVSSVYQVRQNLSQCLFLAISQSGRSPDLLAAVDAAKAAGAVVVALVNVEDSPLAERADYFVPLRAGPEKSVAATKSYIGSLAAIIHLVARWSGNAVLLDALTDAPPLLQSAWQLDWQALVKRLTPAQHLLVLGRGLGLGIAQEIALKLKETCALHAEAFSSAEVRHGPMALVGPEVPVLLLNQQDETEPGLEQLAEELAAHSIPVLMAGAAPNGVIELPAIRCNAAIAPLLWVQSFYRAAVELSLARGLDPDRPPHLRKVTETV